MFSSISIEKNVKILIEFKKTYTRKLSSWFGEKIRSVSQPVLHHVNIGWRTWMFWCFCLADMINFRTKPKHRHKWCESAHQRYNEICFLSKSVMLCKLSHSRNFSYIGVCAQISIRCHYLMWLENWPDLLLWFNDGVAFVFSVSVGNLGPVRLSQFFRAIPILAYEPFDKSYWTVHKYIILLCRKRLWSFSPTRLSWRSWRWNVQFNFKKNVDVLETSSFAKQLKSQFLSWL